MKLKIRLVVSGIAVTSRNALCSSYLNYTSKLDGTDERTWK